MTTNTSEEAAANLGHLHANATPRKTMKSLVVAKLYNQFGWVEVDVDPRIR